MTRLVVHVEGQSEETFVYEVLAPHLAAFGYDSVWPRIVGNARLERRTGGIKAWSAVRTDIIRVFQEDPGCLATTMVDYYGLPKSGPKAWPGRDEASHLPVAQRGAHVERALAADITKEAEERRLNPSRFLPFVTMHEFEALLFSDCAAFSQGICQPHLQQSFQDIRDQFGTPEEINDSPHTAPSRRVLELVPGYTKPLLGNLAILEIGLEAIRRECPHFGEWIKRLEEWPDKIARLQLHLQKGSEGFGRGF